MKIVNYVLLALFLLLQYPLWFGSGGVLSSRTLNREIGAQQDENVLLTERNRTLAAEVVDLQQGLETVEERARSELGMVKKGETFFQVVETAPAK